MKSYGGFESKMSRDVLLCLLASAALACWGAVVIILVDSGASAATAILVYATAATAATAFVIVAAVRAGEAEGLFWSLVGVGLVFRFLGDVSRGGVRVLDTEMTGLVAHDVAYVLSYLALLAAFLWLVRGAVAGITPVAALDALCIMLSVGLLVWYFALGPTVGAALGPGDWRAAVIFALEPACNAALLSLALLVFTRGRQPVFVGYLTVALVALLFAGALHLGTHPSSPYAMGGWPEAIRASAFAFVGLGALRSISSKTFSLGDTNVLQGTFSFWFGPLSPAVHCGFLFVWGAFHPPLPSYVLLGSTLVVACFALRASLVSRLTRRLRVEREKLAVCAERARISEEMHDSLKQELHSIPLMLELYRKSVDTGEDGAGEVLDRVLDASRKASYRVSDSIWELQAGSGNSTIDAVALMRQAMRDVSVCFAMGVHDGLDTTLDGLTPEELASTYRVVSEALWNAAKHSGARNVWVESGKEGSTLVVCVHDDGRGFPDDRTPQGLGLSLMRRRAEEAGAWLEVSSPPGGGVSVEMRFGDR